MNNECYNNSKDTNDNNKITSINFEITENISKSGIKEIYVERNIIHFVISERNRCIVILQNNKQTIDKLCKVIRSKLTKKLEYSVENQQTLEQALDDIETQVVKYRDEIFLSHNGLDNNNGNQLDNEFEENFSNDVKKLRSQFHEATDPYKEWQTKVAVKYENLEKIFKRHYPEAWIFMEFCLSIKSILNILDFTLPFMGVLVAVPSSLKTMAIQLFRKYPATFYTDSFTPSALVSHNASLSEEQLQKIDMLPKIKDKLVLTPELAPLFTGNEDDLQKVLGIITRLLDGHGLENDSGAHGHRKYGDAMFVWLGAVVEIPPRVWKLLGSLGHKIYFLRPALKKKTVKDIERLISNNNFSSINKEIEDSLLKYLKIFDAAPEIDGMTKIENGAVKIRWKEDDKDHQQEQALAIRYISQLATLLASLRGTVTVFQSKSVSHKTNHNDDNNQSQINQYHQQGGQDYDTDFPIVEDPLRAAVLLRNLAIGHAASMGRDYLTPEDVSLVVKVALSTAPVRRVKLLDLLLKSDNAELTTSQITTQLSVSQPIATKTMREFNALGIADISDVSGYDNAEHQIKLKSEFIWFRTKEFQDLKGDFVPYEKKKNENENDDFDNQFNNANNSKCYNENHIIKKDNIDNSITQNKDGLSSLESKEQQDINSNTVESSDTYDNNKGCHTLKDNLPSETLQKNNVLDNEIKKLESSKEDSNIHSSTIQNKVENIEQLSSLLSSSANNLNDDNIEKNNVPLWGSKSFEHVTMSYETKEVEGDQSSYQISSHIRESDGDKYIALQEILKVIKLAHGSTIAVNYAIESACKNNKLVRDYLGDKLTSRENRNVRDLVSNIIRHPNIKVIKHKPQLIVCWLENKDSLNDSQKGETA